MCIRTHVCMYACVYACMYVGRSRFPSPVQFYRDKCVYEFHHPYDRRQITMVMYYTDMAAVVLKGCNLGFKINHDLCKWLLRLFLV